MEYLDSVSGGESGIIEEIAAIFKEQSVEIYDEMKSLLVSKNYTSLGLLAHKAKSSVAIMGMTREGKEPQLYEHYLERFKNETEGAILELDSMIKNGLKGK